MQPLVSVCIACHNQGHLVGEAIDSCNMQDYQRVEIILLDDASTDNTSSFRDYPGVTEYHKSDEPSGTGGSFNKAITCACGEFIVLLCADDVFTDHRVISDIVRIFESEPSTGHVSRYYHQFVDGDRRPVRAWRTNDPIHQANNPSGMAFRKTAIEGKGLSNAMFVEVSSLVSDVLKNWEWNILKYDTIAVRIHKSISRTPGYYKKMWKSSPVESWSAVGGASLQTDFTSLIQIKNNFTTLAVLKECWNFIRLRPMNLIHPAFWFFALISILTPRCILYKIPEVYRASWGRWTTKERKRK